MLLLQPHDVVVLAVIVGLALKLDTELKPLTAEFGLQQVRKTLYKAACYNLLRGAYGGGNSIR